MKDTFTLSGIRKYPRVILTEEFFREEMRNLIPDAVEEIRDMLRSFETPPATKAKLIDLILKYGKGEKAKSMD